MAGLLVALGLSGCLLAIVLARRGTSPALPAAGPSGSASERELREIRRSLETWAAEQSRRLDEISGKAKSLPPEELESLRRSVESLHATQRKLEERLKAAQERSPGDIPAPPPPERPPPPPDPMPASPPPLPPPAPSRTEPPDPAEGLLLARLRSEDPRERHAALLAIPGGKEEAACDEAERLLADPYSYVRREAAAALGRGGRAEAVPTLLSRLEAEEDPIARQRVLSAIGTITGLPYDPRVHRGAALIDRIQLWRDWKK